MKWSGPGLRLPWSRVCDPPVDLLKSGVVWGAFEWSMVVLKSMGTRTGQTFEPGPLITQYYYALGKQPSIPLISMEQNCYVN